MGSIAQGMVKSNHPDSKMIQNRQGMIAQQVKNLQKMANTRRQKLMESMYRHEYFRESDELEQWINEMMQIASSEDYGKDYEHLVVSIKAQCNSLFTCLRGPDTNVLFGMIIGSPDQVPRLQTSGGGRIETV